MKKIMALYAREDWENFLKYYRADQGEDSYQFILGCKEFSRYGNLHWSELRDLAIGIKEYGHDVFFQWDILMTGPTISLAMDLFRKRDLSLFKGVRVQDVGALEFLKKENYGGEVHFICENGNHNTLGLSSWHEYWPSGIKRLVLSAEIPWQLLSQLRSHLKCDLEILGGGQLLLFYSPRHLLSALTIKEEKKRLWATSEESPHKGFPLIENSHGTFMFNTREVYIFDEAEGLKELSSPREGGGDFYFRLDYPMDPIGDGRTPRKMPQTKGFFRVNKTNILFKKLKNVRLQDRGRDYIGEVVDVKKKRHLGIFIKSPEEEVSRGDFLRLLTPEGGEKIIQVTRLESADGNPFEKASCGQIIFIPHVGGVSVRTMVLRADPKEATLQGEMS